MKYLRTHFLQNTSGGLLLYLKLVRKSDAEVGDTTDDQWNLSLIVVFRSSHQRCSMKKGVLKSFVKLTRKHLCQSLFFNKVVGLMPATLLKRDSGTGVFL